MPPLISLALHGRGRTRFAAVWSAVGSGSATPLWLGTVNSGCRARYRFVWILRFEGTGLVRSFGHCGALPLISLALHGRGRTRFAPPWCRRACLPMFKERRNVSADVHGPPMKKRVGSSHGHFMGVGEHVSPLLGAGALACRCSRSGGNTFRRCVECGGKRQRHTALAGNSE